MCVFQAYFEGRPRSSKLLFASELKWCEEVNSLKCNAFYVHNSIDIDHTTMALTSSMCRMLPNPHHHPRVLTQGSRLMHGSRGNSHSPSRKNQRQAREAKEEHGSNKRWLTYNHTSKPTPQSIRERNITVTSYYNQTAIDEACQQNSIRLTPSTIMYTGPLKDGSHIMKSAKYLRRSFLFFWEWQWQNL